MNEQKLAKKQERLGKIDEELAEILGSIVDAEGSARDRLAKKRADLIAEKDLVSSEIQIINERLHAEKVAAVRDMLNSLEKELAEKNAECTQEQELATGNRKKWADYENNLRASHQPVTRETIKESVKNLADAELHERLYRLVIQEKTALEYKVRDARKRLDSLQV